MSEKEKEDPLDTFYGYVRKAMLFLSGIANAIPSRVLLAFLFFSFSYQLIVLNMLVLYKGPTACYNYTSRYLYDEFIANNIQGSPFANGSQPHQIILANGSAINMSAISKYFNVSNNSTAEEIDQYLDPRFKASVDLMCLEQRDNIYSIAKKGYYLFPWIDLLLFALILLKEW